MSSRAHGSSAPASQKAEQNRPRTPTNAQHGRAETADADDSGDGFQRIVLPDPIAFRYLEQDPSASIVARRQELRGYECYIVEQWTTSRAHPTFVITTYTGDPSHVVIVSILSVPTDESVWSARLRVYFKALNQDHARRRDTPLGIMMVTSLSGFSSSLTVIRVPDGDVKKHRFDFFVNENLKRLGCAGRSGLTLAPPAPPTVAKFHQLYQTSDKNAIYQSVIELVKLCQSALMLFAKLEVDYADGLLCDITERAIGDWWADIGGQCYPGVEPHDGILGPTSIAALLGLLMGARNRLHSLGMPVAKDPFDVEAMKRGIGAFQKSQRALPVTRRLDRDTLDRLHRATQRAAEKDRWQVVPRAVKSTVAELSGKGGEAMLDAVSRRDRAGIADIETVDMQRFVQLIFGERAKWLWQGKSPKGRARKGTDGSLEAMREDGAGEIVQKGAQSGMSGGKPAEGSPYMSPADRKGTAGSSADDRIDGPVLDRAEDSSDNGLRASVFRKASTLRKDAKQGLGRVKGAVGIKGHKVKPSTAEEPQSSSPVESNTSAHRASIDERALGNDPHEPVVGGSRRPVTEDRPSDPPEQSQSNTAQNHGQNHTTEPPVTASSVDGGLAAARKRTSLPKFSFPNNRSRQGSTESSSDFPPPRSNQGSRVQSVTATAEPSVAGSVYEESDGDGGSRQNIVPPPLPGTAAASSQESPPTRVPLLQRSRSFDAFASVDDDIRTERLSGRMPRHLSFSLAEDSVLVWPSLFPSAPAAPELDDLQSSGGEPSDNNSDPASPVDGHSLSLPAAAAPHPSRISQAARTLASEHALATDSLNLHTHLSQLTNTLAPWTTTQLSALSNTLLADLDRTRDTLHSLADPLRAQAERMQTQAQTALREARLSLDEGAKEIETLAARLEYEIAALRGKVEDVAVGVVDFEKGVVRVEERVSELEREEDKEGWVSGRCVVC